MTADFPFARTLIVLRSERTIKKTGLSTTESRDSPDPSGISTTGNCQI